ncbi:MAG: GntR family transcriptional regulator [Desulforhopalus sp.]
MSNKTMRDQAFQWLKKKIITLEYPMGSALVENDVCHELGMGRTPVREAIQQLAAEGLVSILPRKGTFVSNISFWDFEKLLETRLMLETHVVRELANSITPEQVAKLRSLFDEAPSLLKDRNLEELLKIDRKFHQELVAMLDNPYLDSIAEHIYDLVTRTWYLSFRKRSKDDLALTLQDHLEILDKLEQGRADAAEEAVRAHVLNFKHKLFQ